MTIEGIGLFSGIKSKLDYINTSQRLVTQNIANADTPGYQPKTLGEVDFSRLVQSSLSAREGAVTKLSPNLTNAGHLSGGASLNGEPRAEDQRVTYEVSPTGNAVIIEEQLIQANRNQAEYGLLTRILQKNVGMIQRAAQISSV